VLLAQALVYQGLLSRGEGRKDAFSSVYWVETHQADMEARRGEARKVALAPAQTSLVITTTPMTRGKKAIT